MKLGLGLNVIVGSKVRRVYILSTPVMTWDGNSADASPNFSLDLDATTADGDTLSLQYSTTSDFAIYTQIDKIITQADIDASIFSISASDLSDDTYYFRAKQTRSTPDAVSAWSSTVTVTVSAGSLAPAYLSMIAA